MKLSFEIKEENILSNAAKLYAILVISKIMKAPPFINLN